MSFGFGFSDFIKIVEVSHKLISKCKAASLEFRDLSRDVASMQIVLDAVRTYWQVQSIRGRDLSDEQKEQLEKLAGNCVEVMREVESLLQKHEGLAAGTGLYNRIKWLSVSLSPLRMRLQAQTTYLAQFNSIITAYAVDDPKINSQARVLNALNIIYYRYNSGRRSTPAFSQTTAADLDKEATWQEINEDLEKEGLDQKSLVAEKPFIKSWIDEVILAEDINHSDHENQLDDASTHSTHIRPWSEGEQDRLSSYTEENMPFQWIPEPGMSRKQTEQTLVNSPILAHSPTLSQQDLRPTRTRDSRASISSRENRRASDHQPRQKPVQASLTSLFRLEHGVSPELPHLRMWIEHLFAQLDSRKRGIFRGQFEPSFIQAISIAKPEAKSAVLEIILSDTTRTGSRLDEAAFVNMVFKILERLENFDKLLEETKSIDRLDTTPDSNQISDSVAYAWLITQLEENFRADLLPYGWTTSIKGVGTRFFSYTPSNTACHRVASPTPPRAIIKTFTGMHQLVTRCIAELYQVLEAWEIHDDLDENYLKVYLDLLEDVLEAAHKFDVFDPRQSLSQAGNLDQMIGQAEVIDMTEPATLEEMSGFPVKELRDLQRHAFCSLQAILKFLVDLTHEDFQSNIREHGQVVLVPDDGTRFGFQFPADPPAPGQWRLKMEAAACRILADANRWWEGSTETINACRNYTSNHKLLSRRATEALDGSKRLAAQAKPCRHLIVPRPIDIVTDRFVILVLEGLEDLPKGNKYFRAGPPDIVAKIIVDNIELGQKPAIRKDGLSGKQAHFWSPEPFHISLSATSTVFVRIHNNKRRVDRIDEGFMGLIELDIQDLPTGLDCKSKVFPLKNTYKPGNPAGNLTLKAHWCLLAAFARTNQSTLTPHWARKDTADDRFYFEDLKADEKSPGSRTAIFETRREALVPSLLPLRIIT